MTFIRSFLRRQDTSSRNVGRHPRIKLNGVRDNNGIYKLSIAIGFPILQKFHVDNQQAGIVLRTLLAATLWNFKLRLARKISFGSFAFEIKTIILIGSTSSV